MRLELENDVTAFPLTKNGFSADSDSPTSWNFESLLKKGMSAAQSGDRDQARKLLSQVTAINPASEDAWMWLASISDYPEELLAFLNRVLDINPDNEKAIEWRTATNSLLAKTFVQRALAAHNDGTNDLAEQFLDEALTHDPDCETAWFWKASLAKSVDQKLEFFDRVLTINPDNTDASDAVAEIKRDQTDAAFAEANEAASDGNRERAFEILDELVGHESDSVRETAWLAKAAFAESDDQKLNFLDSVLQVNPDNHEAVTMVAEIRKARSEAAFNEAKSAAAEGNRKKAVEILDAFVRDTPDSVEAWLLKSHLSVGLDEKVDALEKALEIDPHNAAARSGLEFLSLTFGSAKEETPSEVSGEDTEANAFFADLQETSNEPVENHDAVETVSRKLVNFDFVEEVIKEIDAVPSVEVGAFSLEPTEEDFRMPEMAPEAQFETDTVQNDFVDPTVFESKVTVEPAAFENLMEHDAPAVTYNFQNDPNVDESAKSVFNAESEIVSAGHDTDDSVLSFTQDAYVKKDVAAEFDETLDDDETSNNDSETVDFEPAPLMPDSVQFDNPPTHYSFASCPFCTSQNEPQAFTCSTCNATLTLSDMESLLSSRHIDSEVVQNAVTTMEAEWNLREFSEQELTALAIGHLNLKNFENGLKYLQEAARMNSNNVILGGQANTLAIRLDEKRRQSENHDAMPKGKNILVVDDSPTVRKLISGKLEKSGHNVVCAVDGVDALAKLEEGMPDLVLLDITMPRMDGYEVCKQIRSTPAGKDLPVVMISGKDGFFDKVRGRMAGTTGYVTKPFGPETLMKALETYLLPDSVEVS